MFCDSILVIQVLIIWEIVIYMGFLIRTVNNLYTIPCHLAGKQKVETV